MNLLTPLTTPKYEHDCTSCIYLETIRSQDHSYCGQVIDMYFCPSGNYSTIVLRHSNEGSEYRSGLVFLSPDCKDTRYALSLALERDLLTKKDLSHALRELLRYPALTYRAVY